MAPRLQLSMAAEEAEDKRLRHGPSGAASERRARPAAGVGRGRHEQVEASAWRAPHPNEP